MISTSSLHPGLLVGLFTYQQFFFTYQQVFFTYQYVSFTYWQVSFAYWQVFLTYWQISFTKALTSCALHPGLLVGLIYFSVGLYYFWQVSFTYWQVSFTKALPVHYCLLYIYWGTDLRFMKKKILGMYFPGYLLLNIFFSPFFPAQSTSHAQDEEAA